MLPKPYYHSQYATLYQGDCLDILPELDTSSVHMILCDLPYGTTYCAWDSAIPLPQLWGQLERIIIDPGAMVFTCSQPFTTHLIQSNISNFKYEWIWDKKHAANFANANHQPLKQHENVAVFSRGVAPYYPQKEVGLPYTVGGKPRNSETMVITQKGNDYDGMRYPKSILQYPRHSGDCQNHPTEKPVELMEYLIKTHSREDDTILDATCGSGTTLVAALKNNRKAIGIELLEKYCETTKIRVQQSEPAPKKKYNVTRA